MDSDEPRPLRFEDLSLEDKLTVARDQAKKLTDQLREAYYKFETVREVIDAALRAGITSIDDDTRKQIPWFDDTLADLIVKSARFSVFVETTAAEQLAPMTISPTRIDPVSDPAIVIRSLLRAIAAVTDAAEEILKETSWKDREYYVNEISKAAKILHDLMSMVYAGEQAEPS